MASKGGAQTRTKRQQAAYDRVKYARRTGRAPKVSGMCRSCGKKRATESHHSDYSKPRSITFMCASCNRKRGKGKHA